MVALVFGAGALAQAKNENPPDDGPVIQIGRSDGTETAPPADAPAVPVAPKYWIGLLAGEISAEHPLRAHLDLPENQGLLVASVVPKSPAEKAGLKQNDILLRANDSDLHTMKDLVDIVGAEGPKKGQITLEVFRRGNRESVYLTPEERPADAQLPQGSMPEFGQGGGFGFQGDPANMAQQLLREFNAEGGPQQFAFRNFGPGVIVGGGQGLAGLPNGVSVSIQKQDGQPTKVTVKRGDQTWEVTGDDEESLKALPEDLRPFVEQMLHGGGPVHFNLRDREGLRLRGPDFEDGGLRERLERMEKRMDEMMQRMQERQQRLQPNAHPEETK
jgi:hypothetical protein